MSSFFIRVLAFSFILSQIQNGNSLHQNDASFSSGFVSKIGQNPDRSNHVLAHLPKKSPGEFNLRNLVYSDCNVEINPSSPFGMRFDYETNRQVPTYVSPLVADLNNDEKIEIVSIGMRNFFHEGSWFQGERSGNILIFEGETGKLIREINTPMMPFQGPTPIVIGDINNDGNAEIIISTIDHVSNPVADRGVLICYDHEGDILWKSSEKVGQNAPLHYGGVPSLADFNQDGNAEVYIYNEVFNAQNGKKLLDGGDFGIGLMNSYPLGALSTTIAADFLPKTGLELAAGNTIYEIEINNTQGENGNTMTPIVANFHVNGFPAQDGYTAVADVNLDGELDIIITSGKKQSPLIERSLYAWDPRKKELISSTTILQEEGDALHSGLAFIGDVTGDGEPEIGVASPFRLDFFRFNGSKEFQKIWSLGTTDASGQTRLTMFDFNGDGTQEIVFKDETSLRILNAETDLPQTIASYPSFSDTGAEGPVVADLNNDGHAQLIFTSNSSGREGPPFGKIEVLTSSEGPWIPSRKVWNQYTYYNRNINDDLSIPQFQKNLSQLNSDNGLSEECEHPQIAREFNNFLVQSPLFDINGCISTQATDASIELFYEGNSCLSEESFIINYRIINKSKLNKIKAGIEISFYRGNPGDNGEFIKRTKYQNEILPNAKSEKENIIIPWIQGYNEIFAVVNTSGNIVNNELKYNPSIPECNYENNLSSVNLVLNYIFPPTAEENLEFCNSATFSNIPVVGENVKWYTSPNSNQPINNHSTIPGSNIYFASQTLNGCESFQRTPVNILINNVRPVEGPDEFVFCVEEKPTINSLSHPDSVMRWYSSDIGGEPLINSTPLWDNTTYYAVNYDTISGCESASRKRVFIRVQNCDIEIFNAVTFDNNNKNEFFRIHNIELFPDNYIEIYNRYGKLVYKTSNYGEDENVFKGESNVDGVHNKQNGLPTGNYLYVLKYKSPRENNFKTAKGTLFLNNNK